MKYQILFSKKKNIYHQYLSSESEIGQDFEVLWLYATCNVIFITVTIICIRTEFPEQTAYTQIRRPFCSI